MCGSCCKGWRVFADEKSLINLKKNKKYIENIEDLHTGKIKFNSGVCSFLETDESANLELCNIHKNLGEKALPSTCKIYPRVVFFTERNLENNSFELSLSLSCPIVLKLINRDKKIDYLKVSNKGFIKKGTPFTNLGNAILLTKKGKINYYFLENSMINIIQNRENSIYKRILKLKNMLFDVDEVLYEESYLIYIINQLLKRKEFVKKIEFDLKGLLKLIKFKNINLINELGINVDSSFFSSEMIFTNREENILEHYIVNFLFSKEFFINNFKVTFTKLSVLLNLIIIFKNSTFNLSLLNSIFIVERAFAHNKNFNTYIKNI